MGDALPSGPDYFLRTAAGKATQVIAKRWGPQLGIVCVTEYPKSGGTWLGRLIADSLDLPLIQEARLPVAMPCVLHGHWSPPTTPHDTVYVYRDGRDVMVSYYYHVLRARSTGFNRRPEHVTGEIRGELMTFMAHEFSRPRSSKLNWCEHVLAWRATQCPAVSYEQLLGDPVRSLKSVLADVGRAAPDEVIAESVARRSFERMSRREPGQEDISSFMRRGVAGDWRRHFTRAAGRLFHERAGEALLSLGYEESDTWFEDLPEQ